MAHPKIAQVRRRYGFRCGYCGVSEEDSGGELTVDHFCPVWAGGDDSDENLVYACFRCNVNKGALLPGMPDNALRLLHPKRDDSAAHFQEDENIGFLVALTETGRFHITALRLNRPALIGHRRKLLTDQMTALALEQSKSANAALQENFAKLELYVANLEERLGL